MADYDDGYAAYERGDYTAALREWLPLAEAGNANAQHNPSVMYRTGQGVPQDDAEAVRWFRLAAEQGNPLAQYNLGNMYANGQGVAQDDAEAVKWFRLAAEQGVAEAQFNLGLMYDNGQGVAQDDAEAHMWFDLAASRFLPGDNRDDAVRNRDLAASLMTPEQLAEAKRRAREWRPKGEGD